MSHISKIDTKITDVLFLRKALNTLGMTLVEASVGTKLVVKGYGKDELIEECDFEIKTGCQYGIGIRKLENKLEVVADWWAIETFTGQKQEDLMNRITKQYAYETVMDKVRGMGYSVVSEDQDLKENLRITVRRWG